MQFFGRGTRTDNLWSPEIESNSLKHCCSLLACKVVRLKLTKLASYELTGIMMDNALFCTLSMSLQRYLGRAWWKTGEQYSRTGLIAVV